VHAESDLTGFEVKTDRDCVIGNLSMTNCNVFQKTLGNSAVVTIYQYITEMDTITDTGVVVPKDSSKITTTITDWTLGAVIEGTTNTLVLSYNVVINGLPSEDESENVITTESTDLGMNIYKKGIKAFFNNEYIDVTDSNTVKEAGVVFEDNVTFQLVKLTFQHSTSIS